MKGKLFVLEGIDGSGKSTQLDALCTRLENEGQDFQKLVFPQYDEPSSALIRMYLAGDFGQDPNSVNPFAASTFYAVDRYASYVRHWREYYLSGGLMIAGRYATSNAIHQAAKLPVNERERYFAWLSDFEYGLLALPKPDVVLYLDVPQDIALQNIKGRQQKADIHETDVAYLKACRTCAQQAAEYYGWRSISCAVDGKMRSVSEIHAEIYAAVKGIL